jgi:hypothetical protein
MQTAEIPRDRWRQALNEFSAIHEGWLISIEVLASAIGAQLEVHDLPLVGVVAESPRGADTISVFAAKSGFDHVAHIIHSPTRVWIERTDQGADVALQIESGEGTMTLVRFRTPALPEEVDGVVRP